MRRRVFTLPWFSRKVSELGLHRSCRMNWFRFARAPAVLRVDSEGAFQGIEVQMAAGEAQWQFGIVETHIRLLKNSTNCL